MVFLWSPLRIFPVIKSKLQIINIKTVIMKKQDCVGIDARKTNKKALIQTQNQ